MTQKNNDQEFSNSSYLVKRLGKEYIVPHLAMFLTSIFLMIIIAATTATLAWLVKPALDEVFVNKNVSSLIMIPLIIIFVTIIKAAATYFQLLTMNLITMKITANMRKDLYKHFIYSDISALNKSSSGEMIAKIMMEIGRIVGAINVTVNGFVKQLFTLIFLIGVMFSQSIELSLIALLGFPLAIYPIYLIGRKLRRLSFTDQEANQKFLIQMDDTLQYSKLVKAYNCEKFEVNRMSGIIDGLLKISKKITKLSLIASPFVEMLGGIGMAAVIWYGGHQVLSGETTQGAFFSFFTAMMMAYKPMKSVSGMNSGIQIGLGATHRFFGMLDTKPTIVDGKNAVNLEKVKGKIEFKDVTFSYIDDKTTLDGINLNIEPGNTIALVGHSGGGKSTIMNMILRFYDPKHGQIQIDGHNIKNLTISSLRNAVSVVSQEVMLFDDTIIENIRYGKEDATKEDIIKAAKLAEADEFISELSEGYATRVGQNGVRLSGGQRQRIAIARAILYDAPILLLDEATSALDPISEHLIKNALRKLMKGKTSVVIAHRLSTVMHADRICVVTEGKIVESGKHKELLEKDGAYANLYNKQFALDKEE
jgi:subfamily B ATP-binding cassette protein MsbA